MRNGPHVEAVCSVCGGHIKFVSKNELFDKVIEELPKSVPLF